MEPAPKDTFRLNYTPLDDEQKAAMQDIKVKAAELEALFDAIAPEGERSDRSRLKAVAKTELEGAVMWAVKAVTTAKV